MIRHESATVIPFRASALQTPRDIVARQPVATQRPVSACTGADVVELASFARRARRSRRPFAFVPTPGGEAA